jgi:hypothetical protein
LPLASPPSAFAGRLRYFNAILISSTPDDEAGDGFRGHCDLTKDQARAHKNKLQPMLGYLGRLKRRMVRRGFPNDDPLLAAVVKAEDAMHALHIETHYLACGDKAGRQ